MVLLVLYIGFIVTSYFKVKKGDSKYTYWHSDMKKDKVIRTLFLLVSLTSKIISTLLIHSLRPLTPYASLPLFFLSSLPPLLLLLITKPFTLPSLSLLSLLSDSLFSFLSLYSLLFLIPSSDYSLYPSLSIPIAYIILLFMGVLLTFNIVYMGR